MKFYTLAPDVAGGLGEHTEMDTTVHPPRVSKLHYELSTWPGDDLVESFPCFLISSALGNGVRTSGLTGFELAPVKVTLSPEAAEALDGHEVLGFQWLQITGKLAVDDFGQTPDATLVVSERALEYLLRKGSLENCDIEVYPAT